MVRPHLARLGAAGAAAASLALLAGCGSGTSAAAEPVPPAATADADADATPAPGPTPEQTAGPLTEKQLPSGADLGTSWEPYVQPGGGESGVIPNGSSVQRRDVGPLMDGLRPIGCPDAAVDIALPRPTYALEGSYRGAGGAPGTSLVLQFGAGERAATFLTRLGRQVDACPDGRTVADPYLTWLGFEPLTMTGAKLAALRQEHGPDADPSRYLLVAVRSGDRVALVYLADADPDARARVADGLLAAAAR